MGNKIKYYIIVHDAEKGVTIYVLYELNTQITITIYSDNGITIN